jgi:hypothetical protein
MNDTPLPNSTIRPARDRRQAFVAARAGRTGINVALVVLVSCCSVGCAMQSTATYDGAMTITVENDTFTKSDNNYTNGLRHRDDLANPARGFREPPRDFRRAPRP